MSNERPQSVAPLHSQILSDDADLRDIVEEFVAGLAGRIEKMSAALQAHDLAQLQRLAHQLKGAGGSYGYPEISEVGATIEARLRAQDAGDANGWIARLNELAEAARAGLK